MVQPSGLSCQQRRQVTRAAHAQTLGNPGSRHRGLSAQFRCQSRLPRIAFAILLQPHLVQARRNESLADQAFSQALVRFTPLAGALGASTPAGELDAEPIGKILCHYTPPAPQRFQHFGRRRAHSALLFHAQGECPECQPRSLLQQDAMLSHQMVHPQPSRLLNRPQVQRMTAPNIAFQSILCPDETRPHRIEMDVVADGPQVTRVAFIDHLGLVTPAEKMAPVPVSPIEAHGACTQKPLHAHAEIRLRRLDHQMKVAAHENIGMHPSAGFLTGMSQGVQDCSPVLIVQKNCFPSVPSVHQMVDGVFVLDSNGWGMTSAKILTAAGVSIVRTDPVLQ